MGALPAPQLLLLLLLLLAPAAHAATAWRRGAVGVGGCALPVQGDIIPSAAAPNWQRPFVMHNVSAGWAAATAWRDKSAFLQKHGRQEQHARLGVGSRQVGTVSRRTTVGEYVSTMHGRGAPGLLFGDASGSLRPAGGDWELPALIRGAGLTRPMVSLGPDAEGLSFHNHGTTWEAVLVGQKVVLLLEPLGVDDPPESWIDDVAALYLPSTAVWMDGHVASLRDGLLQLGRAKVALHTCVLAEGMAIFIPCNWWHATRNVGDTVAVGATRNADPPAECAADVFADSEAAMIRVAQAQANGDHGGAEDLMVRSCRLAPFNVACSTSLARLLNEMNRPSEAEDVLVTAAARLTEANRDGLLARQTLSASLLKIAEAMLSLGRRSAQRAALVLTAAAEADEHNVKARVNSIFLRIGQSKSLPEMRRLIAEAERFAAALAGQLQPQQPGQEEEGAEPLEPEPAIGSRFYQLTDQGATLADCSTKQDLTTLTDLADQLQQSIPVVRARLEASTHTEAQQVLVVQDCSILAAGLLALHFCWH